MRVAAIMALAIVGLTMTAFAQKTQKPKGKPTYSEESESKKSVRVGKEPTGHNSAEQELRRVEQSSAKSSPMRKSESAKSERNNPALKGQKKEANPPIHFAATGGSGKSNGKSPDQLKGRLKHKGRH